jgi:hypothetical protein
MDFSFSDESKSSILKLTKDCKEFSALSYVAGARSEDPAKYNLQFLYSFKLDSVDMLVASDGHRMNYAPYTVDGDFIVVKQTKNDLVLERIETANRRSMPAFDKVIPRDKDLFHIRPYDVCGYGTSSWQLEFLIDYLYRLSNFQAAFKFQNLTDFVENLQVDGKIRILCPRKNADSAWRIEHTDSWGNLRHGTVFMPLTSFDELDNVKSPYIKNSGFIEYEEPKKSVEGSDG